jgi:hypothetical protein
MVIFSNVGFKNFPIPAKRIPVNSVKKLFAFASLQEKNQVQFGKKIKASSEAPATSARYNNL